MFLKLKFTIFSRVFYFCIWMEIHYFLCHHLKWIGEIILRSEGLATKLSNATGTDTSPCFQSFIKNICSHSELCSRTFQDEGVLRHIIFFRSYDPSHETALKMAFPASLTRDEFTHSHRRVIYWVVSAFYISTQQH